MLILYLQHRSRAVILAQHYVIEVTILEEEEWESDCKGRELSLQMRRLRLGHS